MNNLFAWPIRIYYEDTDMSGVVYHARYLHFFERARTEWLRTIGISQEKMRVEDGLAFTLSNMDVSYRVAARLDDDLVVATKIAKISRAVFIFEQALYYRKDTEAANGMIPKPEVKPLATALVRCGCVSMETWKPQALPQLLRQAAAS
jgi:acyl-CoA thioester hydrolase